MTSEGSFKDLHDNVTKRLVETTRTTGSIVAEDIDFLRTSNPAAARLLAEENSRLLGFAKKLLSSAASGTGIQAPSLSDADAVEENWRGIVDVIDNLLEKADACLDEYTGIIKKPAQEEEDLSLTRGDIPSRAPKKLNLPKPQLQFRNPPKNDEKTPFKPSLRSKPNALVPLEESIVLEKNEQDKEQYKHPYEKEITAASFPRQLYEKAEPIAPLPFETSEVVLVDTPEALHQMLAELKAAKEIAVDLEHHDAHSYIGIVSLMQISTRNKDWIVDTLKPWRDELQVLNEVFTDPQIIKVFHGSYMDVIWLQRDFGLYLVGLFDTYYASRALGFPKLSLAYLLKTFVDFDAQKQYQTADWRIRPLPKEMFNYARSDTHFLLYVFDNLRNQLIEKSEKSSESENLIDTVMEASRKETLSRYERTFYDLEHGSGSGSMGWYHVLLKTPALLSGEQFEVFRIVHHWRDTIARKDDESVHSVMYKNILFNIAKELPSDLTALRGCASPMSPSVMRRASELLDVIRMAKLAGAKGPSSKEVMRDHPETTRFEAQKTESIRNYSNSKAASVAQVLQRERKASENAHPTSVEALKIDSSQFWGPTIHGSDKENISGLAQGVQYMEPLLQIPLPQLTAEIFVNKTDVPTSTPAPLIPSPKASPNGSPSAPKDELFTLREKGGSRRKRKASEAKLEDPQPTKQNELADDIMDIDVEGQLEDESSEELDSRAEALAQSLLQPKETKSQRKKREKQEAKARKAQEADATEEPFDYSTAPSVLNARQPKQQKGKKPTHFDPYLKSRDAPRGLPKKRREIMGKSGTFKK